MTVVSPQPYAARIGILPSPAWLALSVLVFAAVALSRPKRLSLLGLTLILFAPWLPVRVPPVVYIWTGPLGIGLWILLAVAIATPGLVTILARQAPDALLRLARDPARAPWLSAIAAAAIYLVVANRVSPQLPAGDEPHYLVIAQSLLSDHDLKIENNHRRGDYHAYYPVDLKPDYRRRGTNDEIYSIHAPGLSVIVSPVFALFGYAGVLGFLAVVSGLATALAWTAAWRVTRDPTSAWFGWATVALTTPFCFQSFVAYPDALGAGLIMVGVLALIGDKAMSPQRLALTGLALAALPWLHTRYVVAAVSLGLLLLVRERGRHNLSRRAAALLAIPVVSATCWFGFFYVIYGTPDPRAPYGGVTQTALRNLPQGIVGLLFDQQFGLLPAAPVYLCALAGLVLMVRRRTQLAGNLLGLALPYGFVVAGYEMWWGGVSSPARFLVPILLPLAIPAGVWFESRRSHASRLFGLGALAVSLLMTLALAGVGRGALLYNSRDGASRLLLWLSPLVNLTLGLPSVFRSGPAAAVQHAAIWLAALALTVVAAIIVERRGATPTGIAVALGGAAIVAGSAALSLVWRGRPDTPVTPATGTLAFLQRYDAEARQIAIRSAPFGRLAPLQALEALTLADVRFPAPSAGAPAATLFGIPAGTYAVEATSAGAMSGHVTVTLDRAFGSQWQWDVDGPTSRVWRQEIHLPVSVPALVLDADATARRSLTRLRLLPVHIAGRIAGPSQRLAPGEPQHVARYGPAVVYLMDGSAYMERAGAWVGGRSTARFVVAPDSGARAAATHVQLFVRNIPVENVVTIDGAGGRQVLKLKPGEERLIALTVPDSGSAALSVQVTAAQGAAPAQFEPGSTDRRLLGVWLEIR